MEAMAHEVPVTQARSEFADLVNRVVYGGERVVITRHGKAIVALVSAADLARLESADEPQTTTVVRLPTEPLNQPIRTQPARPFDIAAEHRPPGGPASGGGPAGGGPTGGSPAGGGAAGRGPRSTQPGR
jgi:prevent-host-death family protein